MLEVSSLRSPSKTADQRGYIGDHVGFRTDCDDDFMVDDNLLDYIDFGSCDVPFFDADGDILPDLEVDPTELLAEFSSPELSPRADGGGEAKPTDDDVKQEEQATTTKEEALAVIVEEKAAGVSAVTRRKTKGDEAGSSAEDSAGAASAGSETTTNKSPASASASAGGHGNSKKKASAAAGNNSNGKRKVKVDWTPELHRRFVQAVEQLGIDKAVPSRILEIMGIQCLTRHNIASHLQKYRSHRKHLMAREAEAATWAQKRQMYYAAAPRKLQVDAAAAGSPWVVPTIGFPPPAMAQPPPPPFCRPLHVWGHPPAAAVEAAAPPPMPLPVWPRHLAPPRPLPAWGPAYWQQQYNVNVNAARKWGPHQAAAAVTQGTPCVPPRFPVPAGMVPHPMYTPMVPPPPPPTTTSSKLAELQLQLDAHPSKESIDAAIGDVLVKPWLPLPLGLKPPSLHSVMSELHKQGIPKVPPAGGSTG